MGRFTGYANGLSVCDCPCKPAYVLGRHIRPNRLARTGNTLARPTKPPAPRAPNLGLMNNDDDIKVLMALLPLRMQLVVLARTWETIEKMRAPLTLDEKMKEHIDRIHAARKAAGQPDA